MRRAAVFPACAPLFALALFLGGCANGALVRYEKIAKRAASQDYLEAAKAVRADRESLYGSHSRLLYEMDLGLLYHYSGRYDSSIVFLARAADTFESLYTRSVTNEAASILVNDNVRPYRGRPYEIVWLRVFQAFNYMALGDLDGARVEMRQARILVDEYRRKAGKDKDAYRDDPLYRGMAALVYDALGERDDAAISAYLAVKARRDAKEGVPSGLASLACRLLRAADRADDIRLLELECPDASSDPSPRPGADSGTIVVVGEIGRSPALGETTFQGTWIRDGMLVYHYRDANGKTVTDALPAPGLPPSEAAKAGGGGTTRSGTTLSIKWAMPVLRQVSSRSQALSVADAAGTGAARGEAWGEAGGELERDLERNRMAVLARTVARVALRTLAAEKAKAELRTDNPLINLLTNLGADFLSGQLEQADVRSWFLLPRTIQVARIAAPAGKRTLQVGAVDADGRTVRSEVREVDVPRGGTAFVFFNSLR
jgi:tetratricopeptide (TPR) repeat protein